MSTAAKQILAKSLAKRLGLRRESVGVVASALAADLTIDDLAELHDRLDGDRETSLKRGQIEAWGEVKGITAWARDARSSVTAGAIEYRIARGWTPEAAIATPARQFQGVEG